MIVNDDRGVAVRCNTCGSQLLLGANALQVSVRPRPSGWLQISESEHACPLCAGAKMEKLRRSSGL